MSGRTGAERWRWRGTVALAAVALGFVIYPLIEGSNDVINSDWPAFATGGRLIVEDPGHLYDMDTQRRVQLEVTGGRTLVTLGINGILPFLAPAWVAFLAVPFDLLGTNLGGRLWILAGLACLAIGLYLAVRPRPPTGILPAFASVPTALLLLNAQLDGFVALGIGAALALWTRPFLAGLCLGLTLLKPQLVLPLGAALLLTRQWRVLAGWAVAGLILLAASAALNPRWVLDWVPALGGTVQPGAREVDLAHLGTVLPRAYQGWAVVVLSLVALAAVLWLARRRRNDMRAAAGVLIAGGVLVAPHALPTDLVLVSLALAVWGEAKWQDWLVLSVGAAIAAVVPAPWPTAVGV
ncbi:MAG TPA: glycosyltransferase family 87 protein, partial [Candidatus Dormibacteraeota bacterium]